MELTYYVLRADASYQPIYTYPAGSIDPDEIYARQLCDYLVIQDRQYQLVSNEMEKQEEVLVVEDLGPAVRTDAEPFYKDGVHIEFREYQAPSQTPLLYALVCNPYKRPHWEAVRYLLKDYVDIPAVGLRKRDSAEIDEDRRCYVIYVEPASC
ncbi:RNA helicase [Ectobacillus ponti]|uniref:RNA helicase n=1 Tax=Ectobacillus ponti TaxID=2961894 RepID=A0AA41X8R9_9BACI|nr:RNA helicase [Ectobacillus ponti]MCP8970807.1 RNA helicase [Ectobacillus ponti]